MTAARPWRRFDIGRRHVSPEAEMEMQPLGHCEVTPTNRSLAEDPDQVLTAKADPKPEATTATILTRASVWSLAGRMTSPSVVNVVVSVNADVHCDASTAL